MSDWRSLERSAVLVVDDDPGVRGAVSRFIEREGYPVLAAGTLGEARELLAAREILVVLCDITMPDGESGLDLLAEIKGQQPELDVLMMTGNSDAAPAIEALKRGAYDYIRKPFQFDDLRAALKRAVERRHFQLKASMLEALEERRAADRENLEQVLVSMATIIDAKSRFTARHSARVSDLSRLLAEAMGFPAERVELIALGGRLHDIGKIGTPDRILDKPTALTVEEFAIMKRHPALGDELIAPIRSMEGVRPMIRWHHESLDGNGYPDGLSADQIPVEAWIVKVADYWEAITSLRPYRGPMTLEQAARTLRGEAGLRIPPEIVGTFLRAIEGAPIALPVTATPT
ncbi:MAG TPA: HD domain-containing phosphohydrolase [Planctomycetota bacterium]|nr:HD domain-containing phosphohydrolase [Planctomycetota bacterium]